METLGQSTLKINDDVYDRSNDLQNVFIDKTGKSVKKLNDVDRVTYQNIFKSPNYDSYKRRPGETRSGRYKYIKSNLENHLNWKQMGPIENENESDDSGSHGKEKNIFPTNIIDIYARLELLLGEQLLGHTDTLAEATNLIVEL